MIPTFLLLTLALIGLWVPVAQPLRLRRNGKPFRYAADLPWAIPFLAAVLTALTTGILEPPGLVSVAAMAGAAWWFGHASAARWQRSAAAAAIVVLAAGLMTHLLPGFNNPRVIAGTPFGSDAIPYRLHLNFDKPLVGLFVLAWCHDRIRRGADWRAMLVRTAPIAGALVLLIMVLALAIGYVRFEPKFPREWWLWAWANLFLTCIAEEALFRGFVQARLQHAWRDLRHGRRLALGVAAVLFGVAHAAGGAAYVGLATVAGAGYGLACQRAGNRIEAGILTHFALNATHFLLFTYPALAPAP